MAVMEFWVADAVRYSEAIFTEPSNSQGTVDPMSMLVPSDRRSRPLRSHQGS